MAEPRDPDRRENGPPARSEAARLVLEFAEERARKRGEEVEPRRRRGVRSNVGVLGLIATVGISAVLLTWTYDEGPGEKMSGPPLSVVGRWVTDDPRYEGRELVISEDGVLIITGGGFSTRGAIREVRRLPSGSAVYLEYETFEGRQLLELRPDDRGGMRLRNPPDVRWFRGQ